VDRTFRMAEHLEPLCAMTWLARDPCVIVIRCEYSQ
jgi:hypothetical protein